MEEMSTEQFKKLIEAYERLVADDFKESFEEDLKDWNKED